MTRNFDKTSYFITSHTCSLNSSCSLIRLCCSRLGEQEPHNKLQNYRRRSFPVEVSRNEQSLLITSKYSKRSRCCKLWLFQQNLFSCYFPRWIGANMSPCCKPCPITRIWGGGSETNHVALLDFRGRERAHDLRADSEQAQTRTTHKRKIRTHFQDHSVAQH